MTTEREVLHDIRLALGAIDGVVLWRLNQGAGVLVPRRVLSDLAGAVRRMDWASVRRIVDDLLHLRFNRWGLPNGAADLIGIVDGRFLAIEVKSPTGRQRQEQALWGAVVESRGGVYVVARSVDEALSAVKRARRRAA
jgi:hypothetical protein